MSGSPNSGSLRKASRFLFKDPTGNIVSRQTPLTAHRGYTIFPVWSEVSVQNILVW